MSETVLPIPAPETFGWVSAAVVRSIAADVIHYRPPTLCPPGTCTYCDNLRAADT